jgi:hypothetical protein
MGQPIERSAKKNVFVEKYDEVTSFDGSKCSTRPQLFLKNGGFLGLKHSRRCVTSFAEKSARDRTVWWTVSEGAGYTHGH